MMTEPQIEAAVRELCRLRGLNQSEHSLLVWLHIIAALTQQIREQEQIDLAMLVGRESQP